MGVSGEPDLGVMLYQVLDDMAAQDFIASPLDTAAAAFHAYHQLARRHISICRNTC